MLSSFVDFAKCNEKELNHIFFCPSFAYLIAEVSKNEVHSRSLYMDEYFLLLTTTTYFFSDPILFPSFIHTQKRNPETHLKDPTAFWDFISLRPETTHQVSFLFSDRGIPDGYRHMNGYSSHAFKNVNSAGEVVYVKYHLKVRTGRYPLV